ncbi:MAG: sulfite exporter TauE/SafE family protein [Desulfovibrionaceae bacterium]|jgi:nickel/cobalt exporter|nr:sulfite exporter TauE/SafE family protein [Desulfovibrionaceae bacterium]
MQTTDQVFWVAVQSGLALGVLHGVNPCGHSWLMLAPFVSGERRGARVALLTGAFLAGTAAACLLIGMSLGAVSALFTEEVRRWADAIANGVIILLGLVLVVRPGLLHSHDHDREHDHDHEHDHAHEDHGPSCGGAVHGPGGPWTRATAGGLLVLGFVNMIVPCPTLAMMYSYAVESGSAWRGTAVFGAYALTTALAVGGVIWALFGAVALVRRLRGEWVEAVIMRVVGLLTVGFGVYSLLADLA